jgi:parallel beta-helix repeat protein
MKRHLKNLARRWTPGLFVVLTVVRPDAAELYVAPDGRDSNPGTIDLPFQTIAKASEGAAPGTTIHVAPGTYREELDTVASGTSSARIRYVSDVRWGAKIRTRGLPSHASWNNKGSYVDIVGFDVSGNGVEGIINFGSNVRIFDNHVHHISALGCPDNGGAGIVAAEYTAITTDIFRNVVHDIGEFPKPCSRVHGIYHSHRGGRIANNIVFRASGWGIHLWHAASDLTIANNLVFNNANGGILVGAGDSPYFDDPTKPADHVTVINNIIYDNEGIGIEELGITGVNNRYESNLVFANQKDWDLQNGLSHLATVAAPPGFVQYDPNGKGNYHLMVDSPAIDRGRWIEAPMSDYDGVARPQGQGIDIGPFEFLP